MTIKKIIASSVLVLFASLANAADISVAITNLTQNIYFTPILITSHAGDTHLFEVGSMASSELQAMAEGGDITGLVTLANAMGAMSSENPAGGMLAPATSTQVMNMDTGDNNLLSIVAMILPSNDGFVGLDAWPIPEASGTYTLMLNAYDAGTEANNELIVDGSGAPGMLGIPADPTGMAGSGGTGVTTTEPNTHVHIHRGNLGDSDMNGGMSDLMSSVHRWLNPVAKVVVTVH